MAFNREAAKAAGYTDQEIDAYLKGRSNTASQPAATPTVAPRVATTPSVTPSATVPPVGKPSTTPSLPSGVSDDLYQKSKLIQQMIVKDFQETGGKRQAKIEGVAKALGIPLQDEIRKMQMDEASTMADQNLEVDSEKKKQSEKAKEITGFIDELKRLYNQPNAKGETPDSRDDNLSAGVLGGIFKGAQSKLNLDANAKTYDRLKKGFVATLKDLSGDTGVLTEQDAQRLLNLLPNFGDNEETARKNWESFDKILSSKLGEVGSFSYLSDGGEPQAKKQGNGTFLEKTLGGAFNLGKNLVKSGTESTRNIIQDVTQTFTARERTKQNMKMLDQAQKLLELADNESDPIRKGEMLKDAQNIFSRVSADAKDVAGGFSSSVGSNPIIRGVSAGSEIAGWADLAIGITGLSNSAIKEGTKRATGKTAEYTQKAVEKVAPTIRKSNKLVNEGLKEATKKKISGKSFERTIIDFVKAEKPTTKAKPAFGKYIDSVISEYKNGIPVEKLKDVFIKHNGAYTASGVQKTSAEAAVDRIVRLALREEANKINATKIIKGIETAAKSNSIKRFGKSLAKGMAYSVPSAIGTAMAIRTFMPRSGQ